MSVRTCAYLAQLLLCVPEPVCRTTSENRPASPRQRISLQTAPIRTQVCKLGKPASRLASAAALFQDRARVGYRNRHALPADVEVLLRAVRLGAQHRSAGTRTS